MKLATKFKSEYKQCTKCIVFNFTNNLMLFRINKPVSEICSVPANGVTRPYILGPKLNRSIRCEIFPTENKKKISV